MISLETTNTCGTNNNNGIKLNSEENVIVHYDGYLIHGSENSTDKDVLYFILENNHPNYFPTYQQCNRFCQTPKNSLQEEDDNKIENRNICYINKDGFITKIYKGLEDEANNALLKTFYLHKQMYENPIKSKMIRIVILKVIRSIRAIFTLFTKHTIYRNIIKSTLRSCDFQEYKNTLKNIIKLNDQSFYNLINNKELLKSIAFQLGQSISLIEGKELYTKNEIANEFEGLRPFLKRKIDVLEERYVNVLEDFKYRLVNYLENVTSYKLYENSSMNIFFYNNCNNNILLFNQLKDGCVIEMKNGLEYCVYFPYLNNNHSFKIIYLFKIEKNYHLYYRNNNKNDLESLNNELQLNSNTSIEETSKTILSNCSKEEQLNCFELIDKYDIVFGMNELKQIKILGKRDKVSHYIVN
ncbi:hypothetical protein ABK040_015671 [Willaertia magna]